MFCADVTDEMSASRCTHQGEPIRVGVKFVRMRSDEGNCTFNVVGVNREVILRRKTVVHREPRESFTGKAIQQRLRVRLFVATCESAAMHPDDSRKGSRTGGDKCIHS